VSFYDCLFDTAKDGGTQPFLYSDRASANQLVNCVFDEGVDPVTARQWFVYLEPGSNGWTIVGTQFIRRSTVDADAKAIRVGASASAACYGVLVADPIIRVPAAILPPPLQIQIQRVDPGPYSECVVLGGYVEAGSSPTVTRFPLDLTDSSIRTSWIGHRRWRMPQVTLAESQSAGMSPLRLGDLLTRNEVGLKGLEARSEATSPGPSGVPLTVNRHADLNALQTIDPALLNLGSIAWVNNDGTGNGALMLCTAVSPTPPSPTHVWKKITLAP
jgi:hypothetical protein